MLWSGTIPDSEDEESTVLDQLNKLITADARVENVLSTGQEEIQLARKILG